MKIAFFNAIKKKELSMIYKDFIVKDEVFLQK